MHKYIDIEKLHIFNKKITVQDILVDIMDNYKLTNVEDRLDFEDKVYEDIENWYYIAEALQSDIELERANYKAYIEKNMDARLLMELRKSAILPMGKELYDFYGLHSKCETAEDVKNLRIKYLHFVNEDYRDDDWQYYMLTKYFLRKKSIDLVFNFEVCFRDCDLKKFRTIEYTENEALAHLGVGPLKGLCE